MSNEANKAWNAAHPEKVRESRRKWAEANHEKQNAAKRAWNKANPERHKEANQKDYELHREQRLAQQRRHRKEVNDYIERQKLGKVCATRRLTHLG